MFLDETWATTNMARRYGRAPRGQRVLDAVPHGHWRTTTVVAALRTEGVVAPLVLDGAIDGESFLAYVRQFLAPALLYLPPYSPDLNPIEQVFAKLKALLRDAAARTTESLWAAIGQALRRFPAAECARYIAHCGYVQSE